MPPRVLEATGRYYGEERSVHRRVAEAGGAIYIDLCNEKWQVVEIKLEG